MARQKQPGSGRKSKGVRELLATRVSPELAAEFRAEAERLDLSYNDLLANLVAEKYGFPPVAVPKANEDQLKLTA